MTASLARVEIRFEQDVVHARQRARLLAGLLGFDRQDQTRIGTAVSEIARNAHQYGGGGEVEFILDATSHAPRFTMVVRDQGPGIGDLDAILEGRYASCSGMGLGIMGSRRLLGQFHIRTNPGQGTVVTLGKALPPGAPPVTPALLRRIADHLTADRGDSPLEEIRTQNRELLAALEQIRRRDEELIVVNRELAETNAGMVALYSQLKNKTDQLQLAEQTLRARNENLKGFAYTVSHDLKAPLRGISGYAGELERKHTTGLGERARFCVTQIQTATRNLDQLIDDLLHYSRMETEAPMLTTVNLHRLVETILKERARTIAELHAQVTVELPFATLLTWEPGLLQLLTNLIDNALNYSSHAVPPRLHIRGEELPRAWRLIISDNGIGFDMQYHDRIFGLFNRLVRGEDFPGTGAGLAIVKKVVEKVGGTIRAQSHPGQGATFYLELPKPETEQENPSQRQWNADQI